MKTSAPTKHTRAASDEGKPTDRKGGKAAKQPLIRPIKPFTRLPNIGWIWDNMYCVWRPSGKHTTKLAILCCFTHYTKSPTMPKSEPPDY